MPISLAKKPQGHPTIWAKNLVKSRPDFVPAPSIGRTPLRDFTGFDRAYRRPVDPRPQLSSAKLGNRYRGDFNAPRVPFVGVEVKIVHAQVFEAQTDPDSFSVMANLGEDFPGRILIVAFITQFNPSSSGGVIDSVFIDGVEPDVLDESDSTNCYVIDTISGTNAPVVFNTEIGTGVLQLLIFSVRGSQLPVYFAEADEDSGEIELEIEDMIQYGAILGLAAGPSWAAGTAAVNWTGTPNTPIPLSYVTVPFLGRNSALSVAWAPVSASGYATIKATDSGLGSGASDTTIYLGALAFPPVSIDVEAAVFSYSIEPTADPGLSYTRPATLDTSNADADDEEVFTSVNIGLSREGRLLIFGVTGVFFGVSPIEIVSATLNGHAMTLIDTVVGSDIIYGAWFSLVDPGGLPNIAQMRMRWSEVYEGIYFPISSVTVWSILGYNEDASIFDFKKVINLTSDGSELLSLAVQEAGVAFALTVGAGYSTVATQTWTGVTSAGQSSIFGIVVDVGEHLVLTDDTGRVILSTDDAGIPPDVIAEKYVMAISIASEPIPDSPDVISTAVPAASFSYSFNVVTSPPGHWTQEPPLANTWVEEISI